MVHASGIAAAAAVATFAGLTERAEPATTAPGELDADLDADLARAVDELCVLVKGHDAFDVMAMLAQFLVPPDLALWSESQPGGGASWACAEVVALVLLGLGLPIRTAHRDKRTAGIIPEAVSRAAAVVHLADVAGLRTLVAAHPSPLATVAWRLRGFETKVRGRQYESLAVRINDAILRRPRPAEIWQTVLGFTLDDILAVRTAVDAIVREARRAVLEPFDSFADTAHSRDPGPDPVSWAALRGFLEAPGPLFTVTVDRVAARAGATAETVRAVLDQFSVSVDGRSPLDLVSAFVAGRNPMAGKAILATGGRCLVLPGAIAPEEIRRTGEAVLKRSPQWPSYDRQRARGAEDLTAETITRLVARRGTAWKQLKYRAPSETNRRWTCRRHRRPPTRAISSSPTSSTSWTVSPCASRSKPASCARGHVRAA